MKILEIGPRVYVAKHEHIKKKLNPKDDPCISKIEQNMAIFIGQGATKARHLKIFKS